MKIFISNYSRGFYDIYCLTSANTQMEALGFCLQAYPDTKAKYWHLDEVDTLDPGVTPIAQIRN